MNFKNAARIILAKPGTDIDTILSIVRNEMSLMKSQIIYRIKETIKFIMILLIVFPEIIYIPSLNFSAIPIDLLFINNGI